MKLSQKRVDLALDKLNAEVIPETHPAVPQLNDLFGEHTYFVDPEGLSIVEPAATDGKAEMGQVVKIAAWSDETRTSLAPHEPAPTDVVFALEPA